MPVKNRFADLLPEITAWRQDFHAHPELMYDLPRTAARVAELLRGFGCDSVTEGVGRSGVVAVIEGAAPARPGGPATIGLRADMDALPIEEATGLPYASTVPGRMHACGHDGHTAMLLGAAKYLAETRAFAGRAVLIFQPAEEGGGGGRAMVEDGLIARFGIDEVYALHNWPGLPVGAFAIAPGPVMAAADQFDLVLTGRGGHAANPQDTIDPVVVASHVILALQSIVSRTTDPRQSVVVSVTSVLTETTAHNVIPSAVRLKGTVRTLEPAVQAQVAARIEQIARLTAEAHGATAALDYRRGYPVTVNAPEQTAHAVSVARAITPDIRPAQTQMGAEDFSYMLNERPGAYVFLGNGDTAMIHHPEYRFDDAAIPYGASWLAGMVEARLPRG
ncbi:amidohydrolase [Rhodobacter xanthinilyticus]|uniref:Amidohydrolase n=1 Tax=Rhodobacter xanthinilyticus TaxID=1850250 RepID=A0A1D9MAM6_9RHOB|nr:amidohydrolase [Rhodobacter xanthinilyticus]AOZ68904.1 amidohydrolase [Rhodobacter xanthinilyticus]